MAVADYYSHTTFPAAGSFGSSSGLRAELEAIENGLSAKLPDLAGNGGKIVAVNAGATALEAVTTTGTGSAVRATSPTLSSPIISGPIICVPTFNNPADGATVTLTAADAIFVQTGAGAKAALTFSLPATPTNGQHQRVATVGTITAVTVSAPGGATVSGAPTTMAAGAFFLMAYRTVGTTWYRIG